MARKYGARDTKPRHRRTAKEIKVDEHESLKNKVREELEEKYCLISKDLISIAGISCEELLDSLKKAAVSRLEGAINE